MSSSDPLGDEVGVTAGDRDEDSNDSDSESKDPSYFNVRRVEHLIDFLKDVTAKPSGSFSS